MYSRRILSRNRRPIGYGVRHAGLSKRPHAQTATIACAASGVLELVARPSKMQRSAQLDALSYDLALAQTDHRRDDFDPRLRTRACSHQFRKRAIVLRPAIGIARAVFR